MKKGNKNFKINYYMIHDCNKSFEKASIRTDIEKKKIEMTLEEILNNDEICTDLILNKKSDFKKFLTSDNIIKLIKFSLNPFESFFTDPQQMEKYSYNSCKMLCSSSFCPFKNNNLKVKKENYIISKKIDMEKGENFHDSFENEKNLEFNILDEIFKILDSEKAKKFYLGNFENIVNSLLLKEPTYIINYLFKESSYMLNKLFQHLDNYSIEYILDNIFNILSDNDEDNINNSKCLTIIKDLLAITNEDNNCEKKEYIFDLFLNNLTKYSGMTIIYLFLEDEEAKKTLINVIEKLIKDKNDEILLLVILNFLCELNNVIINSISQNLDVKIDENLDFTRTMNIFKFKYCSIKKINYEDIFKIFKNNLFTYFPFLKVIYFLIAQDIKKNFCNFQIKTENNKAFGLKFINEWKIIVNILKLYIFSFFISDFKNEELFFDQELFLISIQLYFIYPQNNLFQNVFIDFIKLMNNEKCPDYFTKVLLRKNKESSQTELLFKLINNLENNNLLIGANINILKIIYSSSNDIIKSNFDNNDLESICKNFFLTSIIPKFEMKLDNDYDYSFSEIFKSDSEKTFDGNDSDIPRQYDSLKKIIERFLKKCKEAKEKYLI